MEVEARSPPHFIALRDRPSATRRDPAHAVRQYDPRRILSMSTEELARVHNELEHLLKTFYSCSDASTRSICEKKLNEWKNLPNAATASCALLRRTSNGYVQFFTLDVLEDTVKKRWGTIDVRFSSQVRQLLFEFIVSKAENAPHFVRTKCVRAFVEIGVRDWPEKFGDFWSHIEQCAVRYETRSVGVLLLSMALEAFGSMNGSKTSLSSTRRRKLSGLIDERITSAMKLLTRLLRQDLDMVASTSSNDVKNRRRKKTLLGSLRALLSLFTNVKIPPLPNDELLRVMFASMKMCTSEHGAVSIRCFVEIINKVVVPMNKQAHIVTLAKHILAQLHIFTTRKDLSRQATEDYIPQLVMFLSTFLRRHLSRVYFDKSFPIQETLKMLLDFSFMMREASNFSHCLDTWVVVADFASSTSQSRQLSKPDMARLNASVSFFSQLVARIWTHILLSNGTNEMIESLDDKVPDTKLSASELSDDDTLFGVSELVEFQRSTVQSIVRLVVTPAVLDAFMTSLHEVLRTLSSKLSAENAARPLVASDLATAFDACSTALPRLSASQTKHGNVCVDILRLALNVSKMSYNTRAFSRGPMFSRLHVSALNTTSRFLGWCNDMCRTRPDARRNMIDIGEACIGIALESMVNKISPPPLPVISACVSLLRIAILRSESVGQSVFHWKALSSLHLRTAKGGEEFAKFVSCLSRSTQGRLYAIFAFAMMSSNTLQDAQKMEALSFFLQPICAPLSTIPTEQAVGRDIGFSSNNIARASTILNAIMEEFVKSKKTTKRMLSRVLNDRIVKPSSALLVTFLSSTTRLMSTTLNEVRAMSKRDAIRQKRLASLTLRNVKDLFLLHRNVLRCLGHEVDSQYARTAISNLCGHFTTPVVKTLLVCPSDAIRRTFVHRFTLLTNCTEFMNQIADDRTKRYDNLLPRVCDFALNRLYRPLATKWGEDHIDVTRAFLALMRSLLINHHTYFVISKTASTVKKIPRNFTSPSTQTYWHTIFESFVGLLRSPRAPPDVVRFVLVTLDEVDAKHGSFVCFNQTMRVTFARVLVQKIVSGSHALLRDATIKTLYGVARTDWDLFVGTVLRSLLSSSRRMSNDHRMALEAKVRKSVASLLTFSASFDTAVVDAAYYGL